MTFARHGLALVLVLAAVGAGTLSGRAQPSPETVPLSTILEPGFNLIGWTQAEAPVEALFTSLGPAATAVFAWDAPAQRFRTARASGPAFLNDLETLAPGQGAWLFIEGNTPLEWRRQALIAPPAVSLHPGLNLLAWGGPESIPVADVVPDVADGVWGFDPTTQAFRVFRADQPRFLNSLRYLRAGAGLWLQAETSWVWSQPSPLSARVESGALRTGARERTWRLYVPASMPLDQPLTLMIGLHGGFGSGEQFATSARFDAQAEAGQFLAVYPDGVPRPLLGLRTWNGGRCCGYSMEQDIDDVGFISALLDELDARFRIDAGRVFAVGHSNGAILAYRLACELSSRIAGIGAVAGSLEVGCVADEPVSILSIHGDADTSHPLAGGEGADSLAGVAFTSVQESLDVWIALNGCQPEPAVTIAGAITTFRWLGCLNGRIVESQVVAEASHAWPGGEPTGPLRPQPSTELDATLALWTFLSAASR
jgi:polyhydroxybutyrate depolymerase